MTGLHRELKYLAGIRGAYIYIYIYSARSNNPLIKAYYNKYCKVLSRVIKEAKRQYYSRSIEKSHNKIKTIWNIIKCETSKCHQTEQISSVLINNREVNNLQKIADDFNTYFFLTITENIVTSRSKRGSYFIKKCIS
jgi:hypothetical protein